MAPRKEWDDDDGRTIADMGSVGRQRFFVPGTGSENESEFTPKERRMYALGALKAALLIAFAFIAGLGAAVWLMIQIWT